MKIYLAQSCTLHSALFCMFIGLAIPASSFAQTENPSNARFEFTIKPFIGKVAGKVVDENGMPVSSANIILASHENLKAAKSNNSSDARFASWQDKNYWVMTETDDKGRFRFEVPVVVSPRTIVTVIHKDFARLTTYDISEDMRLTVKSGEKIFGQLLDVDSNPISNVEVSLNDLPFTTASLGYQHSTAMTGSNGRFEIRHVDGSERRKLVARKNGFVVQKINWTSNSFRGGSDTQTRAMTQAIDVENGFTAKLRKAATVKIRAVDSDTGKMVPLKRVESNSLRPYGGSFQPNGPAICEDGSLVVTNLDARPKMTFRFSVKPNETSGFLGQFFDLKIDKAVSIEKTIELNPGQLVKGRVVDSKTLKPIGNVVIGYFQTEESQLEKQKVLPPDFVRTDEQGEFSMVVPVGPAKLKMVGEVPGYVTLPSRHPDNLPEHVRRQFVKEISPKNNSESIEVNFQLSPALKVSGILRDEDGKPANDVLFFATHFRGGRDRGSIIVGKTDGGGRYEIAELFDDALVEYDRVSARDRERHARRGVNVLQLDKLPALTNQVIFVDPSTAQSSIRKIRLEDATKDPNNINALLQPVKMTTGRLLDSDNGNGIPGAPVSWAAKNPSESTFGFFYLRTTTDATGGYTMPCLLPNTQYYCYAEIDGYQLDSKQLDVLDGAQQVEDFSVVRLRVVGKLPSLDGLSNEKALEKILQFVENELENLPDKDPDGGWSAGGARNVFKTNVIQAIAGPAGKLVKTSEDPDFQCRVYIDILNALNRARNQRDPEPIPTTDFMFAAKSLLVKHIDRDGVFEEYIQIPWSSHGTFYKTWIMQISKKKKIRAWACSRLMSEFVFELTSACTNRTPDEEFEKIYSQNKTVWKAAFLELGDEVVHGKQLRKSFFEQIKRLEERIKQGRNYNESRVRKIQKLIKSLKTVPSI